MKRATVTIGIMLAVLSTLFCLYSALSFHILQDISTPDALPRVRYDRNVWFILACVSGAVSFLLIRLRRRFSN